MGINLEIDDPDIICDDRFLKFGYGIGEATKKAIRDMAYYEGILLDPTYTGKTFAGLLDLLSSGRFRPMNTLCFCTQGARWHCLVILSW